LQCLVDGADVTGTSNKNSTREATTAEGGARTSIHGCRCREDGTLGARLLHHYAKTDFYKDFTGESSEGPSNEM
jgi:hypothetical protein